MATWWRRTTVMMAMVVMMMMAALLVAGPTGVGAQERPETTLRIVDQNTFVAADGSLDLLLAIELPDAIGAGRSDDRAAPVLSVTIYGRLTSESQVDEPLTQPLNRLDSISLDGLTRNEGGLVQLSVPVRSAGQFDDRDRVWLPEPGVYPTTVEVRNAEGPLATVRTHLVRLPTETADEPARAPIQVSVVLNVSTAEGLTVADATALLTDHPAVPMTVILGHGVINQLRAEPEADAALAAALGGRPVVTTPTIDLDPSALAEIGQDDLYREAARTDRETLEGLGLQAADGIALLDAPLTEPGIVTLRRLGVKAVLDTEDRIVGSGRVGTGAGSVDVIRTDRDLNRVLAGADGGLVPEDGPHRANRALARLTLRRQVEDGTVVLGGEALGVDPAPALSSFLEALSQPGAPRPVQLEEVTGGPSVRVAERPQQDLMPVADLLVDIQQRLATYQSFHRGGGTEPDQYQQRIVAALTRQRNPEDRMRALNLIDDQLDEDLGVIEINQPQPVTLAARAAPIPVVLHNYAAGPRNVVLRFESDKIVSGDDGRVMLVDPGTSSIDVEVEARSLGVSPLEVSIWTPDGTTRLATARFEIRSTAVPGLGLLISIGALALLVLWWFLDHRKRCAAVAGQGEPPKG